MASELVHNKYNSPYGEESPELWNRIAKIPPRKEGCGDKGFSGTDRFYPWWSKIQTPLLMCSIKVKQYLAEYINSVRGKRLVCNLRYTSEVAFSRHTIQDGTKDIIPFANIDVLRHMHAWGHAMMNIKMSLRIPGRNSTVESTYWM